MKFGSSSWSVNRGNALYFNTKESIKRIKRRRRELGMTQADLAEKVGAGLDFYRFIENAKWYPGRCPSPQFLRDVAKALQTTTDELEIWQDHMPRITFSDVFYVIVGTLKGESPSPIRLLMQDVKRSKQLKRREK